MSKNSILAKYEAKIDELISLRPIPEISERFRLIEELNEDYFKLTNQNLPNWMLLRLTDWILIEILNNRNVDKVANSEFAILSPRQLRRRDKRESSVEMQIIDYLNQKYIKNKDSLSKKSNNKNSD